MLTFVYYTPFYASIDLQDNINMKHVQPGRVKSQIVLVYVRVIVFIRVVHVLSINVYFVKSILFVD